MYSDRLSVRQAIVWDFIHADRREFENPPHARMSEIDVVAVRHPR
jgi:hypothetical protein